ncbi:MAG: FAD-dependent oxidoreductase [Smithellaceae bacterium]
MMAKYVIVGGVAGGATTAARLRRVDENSEIILFERGEYISYANCGLPYYLGGTISERSNLFLQTPEGFKAKFNIDIKVNCEVIKINRSKREVEVRDLNTGKVFSERYDKLVLSPGASPVKPPIPGINGGRIFTVRNVSDTDKIHNFIKDRNPGKAIVIGGGFIGLEMAENLAHKGLSVSVVEMLPQVMTVIDMDMASIVHQHIMNKGVELILNDGASSFSESNSGCELTLASGKKIISDMIVLSIGVRPETLLAKEALLNLGSYGGIEVNEFMQTSDPDIYALGDAVEINNLVINKKVLIPLAGPANKQGRIVADNIAKGNKEKYNGSTGTAIAKVFDLTVGSTGASEKLLEREKIPYDYTIIHSNSHAGYYPGAVRISIKLIFSKDKGRVLGAQAVGYDGVDKRIDVFSSYIQNKLTIHDLMEFEQSYAPPYSSAKDPVNIAAFAASNILDGSVKNVTVRELPLYNDALLLDVRNRIEIESSGTISGSINIPFEEIRSKYEELPKDRDIIIFCAVGARGYFVSKILSQKGFTKIYNLVGGYETYKNLMAPQSNPGIFNDQRQIPPNTLKTIDDNYKIISVNACGLSCPGPIMKLKEEIDRLKSGETLRITATDPGFYKDVESWCNVTGHCLVGRTNEKGIIAADIQKSDGLKDNFESQPCFKESIPVNYKDLKQHQTIIVFSDDFDKALASFVIANGALAMGKKVSMFFTFWGLNVIKKPHPPAVFKSLIGRMFGLMLPASANNLKLSKMHMFGMGTAMMRGIMKSQSIASLEEMMKSAMDVGVEIIACQMSMDIMDVKKEELLDGVNIGGVASYLERAGDSNVNLFI